MCEFPVHHESKGNSGNGLFRLYPLLGNKTSIQGSFLSCLSTLSFNTRSHLNPPGSSQRLPNSVHCRSAAAVYQITQIIGLKLDFVTVPLIEDSLVDSGEFFCLHNCDHSNFKETIFTKAIQIMQINAKHIALFRRVNMLIKSFSELTNSYLEYTSITSVLT